MKITGLICEFNPFHNGHLYFIKQAKKISGADFLIAVMSGNYVQRGEPAVFDKFTRTKMAIQNGIDLVLELPIHFSTSSAEYFSYGAIKTLYACSIINSISFGCETADLSVLKEIAQIKKHFNIKQQLAGGNSYITSFQNYINDIKPELNKFLSPNNILASEYIYALEKIKWRPDIYPVGRKDSQHHDSILNQNFEFASGTAIRNAIKNNLDIRRFVPENCYETVNNLKCDGLIGDIDNACEVFHYLIARKNLKENVLGINEGLENRITKFANQKFNITDIIKACCCKRYTNSRLSRAIIHFLLDIKKNEFDFEPNYIRVLGFKKNSQCLLKMIKDNSYLPLITNLKSVKNLPAAVKKEIMATDVYFNTFCKNHNSFPLNYECKQPLVII